MTVHSVIRVPWSNLYACEACRFRGYLQGSDRPRGEEPVRGASMTNLDPSKAQEVLAASQRYLEAVAAYRALPWYRQLWEFWRGRLPRYESPLRRP